MRQIRVGLSVLATAVSLGICAPAGASVGPRDRIPAVRADHAPADPGDAADPAWAKGVVASGFENVTTRRPGSLPTTAFMLYDDKALYIAFRNEQRGVPLVATQATNGVGTGIDDADTVAIDTSGTGSRTYTFAVTPRGTRYQSSSESSRFEPQWSAATHVDGAAWTAELVIPLSALRAEDRRVQTWRINFVRHVAALQEDLSWAYDTAAQSAYDATYWPTITSLDLGAGRLRPTPHADVYALSSSGADRRMFQTSGGSFQHQDPRGAGIDVVYPFTSTLAFVGTIAPDFSNLENDQTTIAPQEFRRSYAEYRPFFAQGAAYLDPLPQIGVNGVSDTTFYTPGIASFDRGYKIEGVAGRSSLGVLDIAGPGFDDQAFGYQLDNRAKTFSFYANGVLAHHADGSDQTYGIGFSQRNTAKGESLFLDLGGESGSFVQSAANARRLVTGASIQTQRITAAIAYKSIGPSYNPVDGYTQLNDIRGPLAVVQYNGVGGSPRAAIKSWSVAAFGDRYLDGSGAVHEASLDGVGSVTFRNLLAVTASVGNSALRVYDQPFPAYVNGRTLRFDQSSLSLGYRDGTPSSVDASFSAGPFAIVCPGAAPQPMFCATAPSPFVDAFLQESTFAVNHTLRDGLGLSFFYDATRERPVAGVPDGQQLRRLALTRSLGRDATMSIGLRTISGTGGYGVPGTNLAVSLHERFRNQNELWFEYGTPAAYRTLNRVLLKYVLHVGGGSGT